MRFLLLIVLMVGFVSAGTAICVDLDDPVAPRSLEVTSSGMEVTLIWEAVIDEPDCSGVDYYNISRDGIWIGQVNGSILTFVDDNVTYGSYSYAVYAVDLVGHNSGPSVKNDVVLSGPKGGGSVSVGGGSGGSSSRCYEDWFCYDWGECLDGVQERECIEMHKCGTIKSRPSISQVCGDEAAEDSILIENMGREENAKFFSTMTGAVTGAMNTPGGIAVSAFVVLALGSFFLVRFKRKL